MQLCQTSYISEHLGWSLHTQHTTRQISCFEEMSSFICCSKDGNPSHSSHLFIFSKLPVGIPIDVNGSGWHNPRSTWTRCWHLCIMLLYWLPYIDWTVHQITKMYYVINLISFKSWITFYLWQKWEYRALDMICRGCAHELRIGCHD